MASDNGRHAFIYSTWDGVYAWIWSDKVDEGLSVALPSWAGIGCPACLLMEDTLIVADGGMRISTFHLTGATATLTDDFTLEGGGCPAMCVSPQGGAFVINYAHNTPNNMHVAYRSVEGVWSTNVFSAGPWDSTKPEYICVAPGLDGLVWVAVNRDSSHSIDIIRFVEGNLFDFHQAVLNHTTPGGLAPNGEFPNVTISSGGGQMLLSYQNHHQEWPCGDLYSYVAVCSFDMDVVPTLLALSTNIVNEVFTWSPVFANPSGFNLLTWELDRNTCVQGPYRLRSFNGAWSESAERWDSQNPNGIVWAPDGVILSRKPWPINTPQVIKLPLSGLPVIKIALEGGLPKVGWSNAKPGDILQSSADMVTWQTVGTNNPTVIQGGTGGVFRVHRPPK